jgi:selenocysteine lyase/cysteine desulfurase
MDAVFFSPHKFIGGPGSSGLLVARRSMFHNTVPTCPGQHDISECITQRLVTVVSKSTHQHIQ